jgi:hypothetical protein
MLSWLNRGASAEKPLALPMSKDLKLRDQFRQAALARFCRTQTYVIADLNDGRLWQEAFYAPSQGWMVFEKRDALNGGVRQTKIAEKLYFIDAIERLVSFEQKQALNVEAVVSPDDFAVTDDCYFKNVAKREGLVFDVEGTVVPTTETGFIIADGTFEEDAVKEAQVARQSLKEALQGSLPSLIFTDLAGTEYERAIELLQQTDDFLMNARKIRGRFSDNYSDMPGFMWDAVLKQKVDKNVQETSIKGFHAMQLFINNKELYQDIRLDCARTLLAAITCCYAAASMQTAIEKGKLSDVAKRLHHHYQDETMQNMCKKAGELLQDLGYRNGVDEAVYLLHRKVLDAMRKQDLKLALAEWDQVVGFVETIKTDLEYQIGMDVEAVTPVTPESLAAGSWPATSLPKQISAPKLQPGG